MYGLLLSSDIKGLKDVLEIFKEQLDEIRGILLNVFIKKALLKIFRKFLEKHPWQSSYLAYFQVFKLANMLNTVFPIISAALY